MLQQCTSNFNFVWAAVTLEGFAAANQHNHSTHHGCNCLWGLDPLKQGLIAFEVDQSEPDPIPRGCTVWTLLHLAYLSKSLRIFNLWLSSYEKVLHFIGQSMSRHAMAKKNTSSEQQGRLYLFVALPITWHPRRLIRADSHASATCRDLQGGQEQRHAHRQVSGEDLLPAVLFI